MKKNFLTILAIMPLAAMAQSTYENINSDGSTVKQQASVSLDDLTSTSEMTEEEKSYREKFLADLKATGEKINENADQWAAETAKNGYPKKKTVKAKAELVDHYIFLLSTQLSDSRLNRFIDKAKVQDKITYWQNYRKNLEKLM